MLENILKFEIVRFVFVGLFNTLTSLIVVFLCMQIMEPVAANLMGYVVVVPISFWVHARYTFNFEVTGSRPFFRFVIIVFVAYLANRFTLVLALDKQVNPYLSQVLATAAHVIVSYIAGKYFVFSATSVDR